MTNRDFQGNTVIFYRNDAKLVELPSITTPHGAMVAQYSQFWRWQGVV